jgi:EAL domain-containing protein (putative c-di-GMP-specific phosphodiesterase class I)/GGDEF domain-containing protein
MKWIRDTVEQDLQPATNAAVGVKKALQEAQALLADLESINRFQAQAPARVVAVSTMLVAAVVAILTVHVFWMHLQGNQVVDVPWVPLVTTLVLTGVSVWHWYQKSVSIVVGRGLIVLVSLVYSLGMLLNGAIAVYALPGAVLMIYIFGPPTFALIASSMMILCGAYVALVAPGNMELVVFFRVMVAAFIALVVLQILARQRKHLIRAAYKVTDRLQQMVSVLQNDLLVAEQARERASTLDTATGLLNAKAWDDAVVNMLGACVGTGGVVMVLVRLEHIEEFLATLDGSEHTFFIDAWVARLREVFLPLPLGRRGKWEFAGVLDMPSMERDMRKAVAERVSRLSQPVTVGIKSVPLFPRIGVSSWPSNGQIFANALRSAEIALLVATDSHRSEPIWFDQRMENVVFGRAAMAQSFDRAMEQNEFELVYQPIIQINGKSLHKVEALIRWNDPHRGRISPAEFIPLAESYGKIVPITRWVLAHAVQQVCAWRQTLDPDFQISVNMPPAFLEWFADRRSDAQAWLNTLSSPNKGVVLEITEGAFLNVTDEILQVLALLKQMGFEIALDDFGVGYSCFAQLDRLPLDSLKIDKSLVDHIETTPSKRTVCNTIIQMGHELGFKVVAEGVETPGQAAMLVDANIDFIQGYVFAKPMSARELELFATRWREGAVAL